MTLPFPIPPETLEGLPEKAIPAFQLLVACPRCDCVSVYRASDFHYQIDQPEALGLIRSRTACVETICDAKNCEAHIEIRTPLDKGKRLETVRDAISEWVFSPLAKCGNGHPLHKRPVGDYQIRWLDE